MDKQCVILTSRLNNSVQILDMQITDLKSSIDVINKHNYTAIVTVSKER